MFNSIYIGYSGLLAFSKGLDALSHNVANLNTPGFKASELVFRDMLYRQSVSGGNNGDASLRVAVGGGVDVPASRTRFRQGELRDTGTALDVAIDGNGFFVLRDGNRTFYTRNGQFDFDANGFLVDKVSGARVAAFAGSNSFSDISLNGLRTNPPVATSRIAFTANLSRGGTTHSVTQTVLDSVGGSHALTFVFTNTGTPPEGTGASVAGSWSVEVRNSAGVAVAPIGEIRFDTGIGSPAAGFNSMPFTFSPAAAPPLNITLFFGNPGSTADSTFFSGGTTSTLSVSSQNGRAAGALTEVTFNDAGALTLKYSNGETITDKKLALAWFNDLSALTQGDHGLFSAPADAGVILGTAGDGMMGDLAPKKVELSNVELTDEFTQMVIIQRGYQASSQVISVTNEMIQQLFDLRKR
jgi:flagellar hook protein FlgE